MDGRKGWLNHPIVLKWFNNGYPYLTDLNEYFKAVVSEWVNRGHTNNLGWSDLEGFCNLGSSQRCPLTHIEEVEYRRVLIFKHPDDTWSISTLTRLKGCSTQSQCTLTA